MRLRRREVSQETLRPASPVPEFEREFQPAEDITAQGPTVEAAAEPEAYERDFLTEAEEVLAASHQLWGRVAKELKTFKDTADTEQISQNIIDDYRAYGQSISVQTARRNTQRYINGLATDVWRMARYDAQYGSGQAPIFSFNPSLQHRLAAFMYQADRYGRDILEGFLQSSAQNIDDLTLLSEQYAAGGAENDTQLEELRQIVAADWHHPDSSQSMLKNFCMQALQDPKMFLKSFCETVATDEKNKKMALVRSMAKFAILATSDDEPDTAALAEILERSYTRWNQVEEIPAIYNEYVAKKVEEIKKAFSAIAGPKNAKSLRSFLAKDDGILYVRGPELLAGGNDRQDRRAAERKMAKRRIHDGDVFMEAVESSVEEFEHESQVGRTIHITKNELNGSMAYTPIDTADVAEHFKMGHRAGQAEDVAKMIEWLCRHPLSRATVPLRGKKTRIDNKNVRIWRLAPEKCPNLDISGEHRYTRIIYTFTKEALVILDVLTHEDYNKKWL